MEPRGVARGALCVMLGLLLSIGGVEAATASSIDATAAAAKPPAKKPKCHFSWKRERPWKCAPRGYFLSASGTTVYNGVDVETWRAVVGLGRRVPTFVGEPRPELKQVHYSQTIGHLTVSFAGTPSSPSDECPQGYVTEVPQQTLDVPYASWLAADFKLTFRPLGNVTYGVTMGARPYDSHLFARGTLRCLPDGPTESLPWVYSNPGVGNGLGRPGNWLRGSATYKSGNTYDYSWSLKPLKKSPLGVPDFLGARPVFGP
jgi:hypothetical protein